MAPISPYSLETSVQRAIADHLASAFPGTTVARSLISAPPEQDRLTVLPGVTPGTAVEPFIGNVDGRVWQDETFTVRVWVECLGNDLNDVEDRADAFAEGIAEIVKTRPDLDDLPGLISFGLNMNRSTNPMWEVSPGLFYRWIDIEISVSARYD